MPYDRDSPNCILENAMYVSMYPYRLGFARLRKRGSHALISVLPAENGVRRMHGFLYCIKLTCAWITPIEVATT